MALYEDGRAMGSWELRDEMFIQNLKIVNIDLDNQGNNGLKLIKYLLKYANNLQKMDVFYASSLGLDFSREINKYEKVSNAEVNFHHM